MLDALSFRVLAESDLPELERMILALYEEDPSTEGMTTEKIHRTVQELTRYPERGAILMFWYAEAVVGYAILLHYWSNEYGGNIEMIDEFYVKPAWRGRGIGASFLDHLSRSADTSVKGFQLEVTPRNERANALYARHGFRPAKNQHLFKKRK